MILSKKIHITICASNYNHFKNLGYKNLKFGNYFEIPIKHLTKGSNKKIKVKCDICGKEKELCYSAYIKNISHGNYYACSAKCTRKRMAENKPVTIHNFNEFSYIIGLFQTDGSLYDSTRNRGGFRLELSKKDSDIIHKIYKILKFSNINCSISQRLRETNFGISDSITLKASELQFRNLLKDWGVPAGKKSENIKAPLHKEELIVNDYIRGLYDGDGSLGFIKNKFPFASFTTQSEEIKEFLLDFISKITSKPKKRLNRNKRDNIYNIVITKEDAVLFCEKIYPKNCLSIDRKYQNAQKIKDWKRNI